RRPARLAQPRLDLVDPVHVSVQHDAAAGAEHPVRHHGRRAARGRPVGGRAVRGPAGRPHGRSARGGPRPGRSRSAGPRVHRGERGPVTAMEPPAGLEPVVQESTPSLIARTLRRAISDGSLGPGEQLGEAALAQSLGVSRGPLREAMQRLTQEGLLISHRNRGPFVADLTPEAVEDMYLLRTTVETAALDRVPALGLGDPTAAARAWSVDGLCRLRATGETAALGRALDRCLGDPTADALDAAVDAMADLADEPMSESMVAADLDFHHTLVEAARSPRLSRVHETAGDS